MVIWEQATAQSFAAETPGPHAQETNKSHHQNRKRKQAQALNEELGLRFFNIKRRLNSLHFYRSLSLHAHARADIFLIFAVLLACCRSCFSCFLFFVSSKILNCGHKKMLTNVYMRKRSRMTTTIITAITTTCAYTLIKTRQARCYSPASPTRLTALSVEVTTAYSWLGDTASPCRATEKNNRTHIQCGFR